MARAGRRALASLQSRRNDFDKLSSNQLRGRRRPGSLNPHKQSGEKGKR